MKAVAYCRVSTNKEEQLDSLESQQNFFAGYAIKNGYELVNIYADEGKSGTKIKNRTQLLKLLNDAAKGSFEAVLIKDISRLARNTVDFLTSIRKLKALNIRVVFVNYDQTSSDSSEFMLTMLSAIAQEESANTSKRVRFGKKQNAQQGRVPNLVFGYDKITGDYFHLKINEEEAAVVRRIFKMYTEKGMGASRIALVLNQEGIKTKRGCTWTQNGICRILANEIYTGKVVNGKQEIEDFLTGKRINKTADTWMVTDNPGLKIISEEVFARADKIRMDRAALFPKSGKIQKHILSGMLKCRDCGAVFRRLERTYKNTYITWVCNGRNSNGVRFCRNTTAVDEEELLETVRCYFLKICEENPSVASRAFQDYSRKQKGQDPDKSKERECTAILGGKLREKQKYMDMYIGDILTMEELKAVTAQINHEINRLKLELEVFRTTREKGTGTYEIPDLRDLFQNTDLLGLVLARLIDHMEVDRDGNIDVFLKPCEKVSGSTEVSGN